MSDGYEEKARSYASLWILAALLGAGFVADLAFGGGVAHLIGWLIAFALVLGLNWVVLYAVRSEKSLTVTTDEVRVGDDAIGRTEIVGIASGIDEAELPVLGWPLGRPRQLKGITVRLFDGKDVVIPTRDPERLRATLAVGEADSAPQIRAAARADLPLLEDVWRRAQALFRTAGYDVPDMPFDNAGLAEAKAVFVAGRPPVGFVRVDEVDGLAHVDELAVVPKWMRQGIGSALIEHACDWARRHGYSAITLTTFFDVPWNGPYYRARGFVELDELTPALVELRDEERALGLDAVGRRIVMRREL